MVSRGRMIVNIEKALGVKLLSLQKKKISSN
jgi:hypothetical protein